MPPSTRDCNKTSKRKASVSESRLKHDIERSTGTPTRLAELGSAATFPGEADDRYHFGPDAGAPLLAAGGPRAHRGVRLAAVVLLQRAQVAAEAAALGHARPGGAHRAALHCGRKDTEGRRGR